MAGCNIFAILSLSFGVQRPMNHRSEADLVECLQDPVAGLEWAQTEINQSDAAEKSYNLQQLYTAPDAAWMHHQKVENQIVLLQRQEEALRTLIFQWFYGTAKEYMANLVRLASLFLLEISKNG